MMLLALILAASPETNLLSLEAGTVIVQAPASWGGTWTPEALSDGDLHTGWCNAVGTKGPYAFVYKLEQRSLLTSLEVSNVNNEEASNAGCSASAVEVSSSSPTEGFTRVASVSMKRGGSAHFTFPKETTARWARLIIPGNLGHASDTELMEVSPLGHPLEPTAPRNLSGTWRLDNGGVPKLSGDGAALTGCAIWPEAVWSVKGTAHGRAAPWRA